MHVLPSNQENTIFAGMRLWFLLYNLKIIIMKTIYL